MIAPTRNGAEQLLATDAEERVLFAMLSNDRCIDSVLKQLGPRDFADQGCREVFKLIAKLNREKEPVNIERLTSELKDSPKIDNVHRLLTDVFESTTTAANAEHDANAVRESSIKRRLADVGDLLSRGARNGQASEDLLYNALADIEHIKGDANGNRKLRRLSLADLREQNPTLSEPVIDGLFREGETVNLVADTKIGKSWMVYGLALSIISGRDWLGFPVAQGRALIVDNELHPSLLPNRIDKVAQAMGVPNGDASRLLEVISLRGDLQPLSGLTTDFEDIEPGEFKAIIMDAKYRFAEAGSDENSNTSEAQFYNQVDRIAKQTGSAIVLVHHATKGNQADKKTTDVGAGAGAQSRAADCHLILRAHEEQGAYVLDAAVRSFKPVETKGLRYEFPLWHEDEALDLTLLEGSKNKNQEKQSKDDILKKARIVEEMEKPGAAEWVTNKMLQPMTGISRGVLDRLLPALQYEGKIDSRETTKGGKQTDEYRLNTTV